MLRNLWGWDVFPFPSLSLPDVLCDPTDLILRKGTPSEAMTGRTASSPDGLLARVFPSSKTNVRISVHSPQDHSIIPLSLVTDMSDATLGASNL